MKDVPPDGGTLFFRGLQTVRVQDIERIISDWAPPPIAWEHDNPGLQCGDPDAEVQGVLVALDPTEEAIEEARRTRANLLVTHHPLFFSPLSAVTPLTPQGRCLDLLIRHQIALTSAHTNLDFTQGGTSFALAELLGLTGTEFLEVISRLDRKIVTFVPLQDAERVADAMAGAGAGRIGNYDHCSFQAAGTGSFRGNRLAQPAVGRRERLEHAEEVRLEMIAPHWKVDEVLEAMHGAHPYEEVAYDVYPLENSSRAYGMGAIGTLPRPTRLGLFLRRVKSVLGTGTLRYSGDPLASISRVAVCGGSGRRLLPRAKAAGAEVFITADVSYHSFVEAAGTIALVDAGHFETEQPVVKRIVKRLQGELRRRESAVPVRASLRTRNPVRYV
jgi:dinuclear metal center YbgI/SA1388 family protein